MKHLREYWIFYSVVTLLVAGFVYGLVVDTGPVLIAFAIPVVFGAFSR